MHRRAVKSDPYSPLAVGGGNWRVLHHTSPCLFVTLSQTDSTPPHQILASQRLCSRHIRIHGSDYLQVVHHGIHQTPRRHHVRTSAVEQHARDNLHFCLLVTTNTARSSICTARSKFHLCG